LLLSATAMLSLSQAILGMSKYASATITMDLCADLCDDYVLTIGSVVRDVAESVLCDSTVA